MTNPSYIEINMVCFLALAILFVSLARNRSTISTSAIHMRNMLLASGILCLSDVVAMLYRGQFFPGARIVIEVSNLIYIFAMPLISMLWLFYVSARVELHISKLTKVLAQVPLLCILVVSVTNPFTNLLFSIDENNLYARGPGVFLHWIVSWFYLVSATIISLKAIKNATSKVKKNEYRVLLSFFVFPIIGCVVQMLFYGISSVQAGITLSILLVALRLQDNRISLDELTGINNRRELHDYVERLTAKSRDTEIGVLMIDVNRFKSINDTLGHAAGDEALRLVANALKDACEKADEHLFLCRYGGDEFVIISNSTGSEKLDGIKKLVKDSVNSIAAIGDGVKLEVSVGYASMKCSSTLDVEQCIKNADKEMYTDKAKTK